jgi:hypothetical protein
LSPRIFVTLTAATLGLAGLSGCATRAGHAMADGSHGTMDMKAMCDMHKQMMSSQMSAQHQAMMAEHMKSMPQDKMTEHMKMMEATCK